ncbi:MAG: response regulator transcription factor [Paenibacillus dendritiformis]|nr:response regulator transcription factor [Paenibacillus dendritiformis]
MPAHLLLVEDDKEIARIVQDHLRRQGYKITWSSTGAEGWEDFHTGSFDLILVDLMLPEMDGYTLCRNIRLSSNVPLLIISARQEDESKVRGLELGADDYITKPFSLSELSARHKKYEGGLVIDEDRQLVTLEEEPISLTAKEWALLQLLAQHPQRAFSKKELYEQVWHQVNIEGNNTVSVHVKSLRTKLGEDIRDPRYIQTVWGTGYRFIGEMLP